ncbi:hypothetical protein MNKW57_30680 [Biformimicrobium ophioploci]|uniref:N-acetyltransferase domain-containing protein n=1 Tax=Biformimicrobium ophioploci TaxID=3036711 RepID=A0ABQ6M387_9GAMM|nr:hypothetical protein MNKW57_30680 [Microbulbifer sp. NKW57]
MVSKQHRNEVEYTVNASLNAVPVYEAFGFEVAMPRQVHRGIVFQPMVLRQGRDAEA